MIFYDHNRVLLRKSTKNIRIIKSQNFKIMVRLFTQPVFLCIIGQRENNNEIH